MCAVMRQWTSGERRCDEGLPTLQIELLLSCHVVLLNFWRCYGDDVSGGQSSSVAVCRSCLLSAVRRVELHFCT